MQDGKSRTAWSERGNTATGVYGSQNDLQAHLAVYGDDYYTDDH